MYYWLIPLIIGFISLLAFLYFRVKEKRVIAVYIKCFTSLMFIATATVAWLTSKNPNSTFGIFVIIGLFFGMLGDVFLDLKFIVTKKEFLLTAAGFIAFALGHIAFILGLFIHYFDFNAHVLYLAIPLGASAILVLVTLLMEKFSKIRYKKMKPFVIVYGFILFFVTTIYLSTAIQTKWNVVTIFIMSMSFIAFALSDLILNNTYFAPGFSGPAYIISNHTLYYIAQFAIAVSLFFVV